MAKTLITGGRIIDPARGIDAVGNVLISGKRIASDDQVDESSVDAVIRADGCLVVPGLIDFHAHVFYDATDLSIPPDVAMLPNCVTTVVDGGTAGTINYELFRKSVIANSIVRIKSLLHASPIGFATTKFDEEHDPDCFDVEKIEELIQKYPDDLLGIKLRISKHVVGKFGLKPLKKVQEIAEKISCRVFVHTTNPVTDIGTIAKLFRPDDVFIHVYQGTGSTIIGNDNRVLPEVKEARKRGVIFDAANGRSHFSFKVAEAALADQFPPDVISTDQTLWTLYKQPVFGLPWIMSKYLAIGMKEYDIIAACTSTPARLMRMEGEIGTLVPGSCADVAILKLIDHDCEFFDTPGDTRKGKKLFMPQDNHTWWANSISSARFQHKKVTSRRELIRVILNDGVFRESGRQT